MSKAWWRRWLDEETIPALALAFAVGQSPSGGTGFGGKLLPFQSQRVEFPAATCPVLPTVEWWAGEAPTRAAGSLTVVRPGAKAPRVPL
jgi:hypothetical protein